MHIGDQLQVEQYISDSDAGAIQRREIAERMERCVDADEANRLDMERLRQIRVRAGLESHGGLAS